jgi:hypothetical protein
MACSTVKFIELGKMNSMTGRGWTAAFQNLALAASFIERSPVPAAFFPSAKMRQKSCNFAPAAVFYGCNNEQSV